VILGGCVAVCLHLSAQRAVIFATGQLSCYYEFHLSTLQDACNGCESCFCGRISWTNALSISCRTAKSTKSSKSQTGSLDGMSTK